MAWKARWKDPQSVGWLVREYVRCGKRNCRCAHDRAARHGPYWYLYWREYGQDRHTRRLRKRYVRRADVEPVRQGIEATKAAERGAKARLSAWRSWERRMRFVTRLALTGDREAAHEMGRLLDTREGEGC